MQKESAEAKEFEQIIRRFELPLLQYATRIMGDRDRARDVVQETLRYKKPDGDKSELVERAVADNGAEFSKASGDFKFAAAVAEFGMLLRDSEHKGNGTFGAVLEWAREGKGSDPNGYRAGFIELVRRAIARGGARLNGAVTIR